MASCIGHFNPDLAICEPLDILDTGIEPDLDTFLDERLAKAFEHAAVTAANVAEHFFLHSRVSG